MQIGIKLTELSKINSSKNLNELNQVEVKELQKALNFAGFDCGFTDGILGQKTKKAFADFKNSTYQKETEIIGSGSVKALQVRCLMPEYDFTTKQKTIQSIKAEAFRQGLRLKEQHAYIIATVERETASTFKPVKEAYWLSEDWRKNNLRYYPFFGRGFVQITWENNYKKYSDLLGIDLVKNLDLALDPQIALFILVHGFKNGTFTGVKIEDYINTSSSDFFHARRCINGLDSAQEIADNTKKYL